MKDRPGPSDMLEELADKAIRQMDRLAVPSFKTALEEMVDFHRFLIDAYATNDETGKAVSFAQIGDWGALHEDWIRQYRRLFERAADFIGRENDFIEIVAHSPLRLLPTDGRRAAPEVTTGLLDLANILVHRLEAWLTRRRIYEPSQAESEPARSRLAGSDKQAYEEVVMRFVGAWETTLQVVDQIYAWRRREIDYEEQWRRYAASWPLLQRHLRNTAYLLAVAVWNEDEIGARYYCEALLRWFDGLHHELEADHDLIKELLTPDLLDKDWPNAQDSLALMVRQPEWDRPSPTGIFSAILQSVLADVIVVVAGVILAWFIERRQNTDIAPRIASRLLTDAIEDDDTYRLKRDTGFRPLMLNLIRIHVAGERFEERGYGHWLDSLVELLDSMTERRVVPGRVYTPSTRDGREDLLMPWLACLLASMPPEGDENTVEAISQLTGREEAFARGDRSLRTLLSDLRKAGITLTPENQKYLGRGTLALQPDAQIEERIERLAFIFDEAISAIEAQRKERLHDRPIDEAKLNAVRNQVELAITSDNGGIEIFQDFLIAREIADFPRREFTFPQIKKGYLTDPAMAQEPVNLKEMMSRCVQEFAAKHVWYEFAKRPRRFIETQDETSYLAALTEEASGLLRAGQQPILLVRGRSDPLWIREWFAWRGHRPEGLQVRRKDGIRKGRYIGTVNDIDVYRADLKENQSLLFRNDLLKTVRYGADAQNRVVEVTFVEGQDEEPGSLVFRFSQETEWMEDEVVVLQYPTRTADGEDG